MQIDRSNHRAMLWAVLVFTALAFLWAYLLPPSLALYLLWAIFLFVWIYVAPVATAVFLLIKRRRQRKAGTLSNWKKQFLFAVVFVLFAGMLMHPFYYPPGAAFLVGSGIWYARNQVLTASKAYLGAGLAISAILGVLVAVGFTHPGLTFWSG